MIVSIDPQGNLRLGPEASPVTVDQLRADLLNRVARTPDMKLAISADKAAPWGQVVKVMDVAKEAKIKMVSGFMNEVKKP